MKYETMQQTCKKHNGKCKNCPLNCVQDFDIWDKDKTTWCLKKLTKRYINKWKMHKERGQEKEADNTLKECIAIQQKYLKQTD